MYAQAELIVEIFKMPEEVIDSYEGDDPPNPHGLVVFVKLYQALQPHQIDFVKLLIEYHASPVLDPNHWRKTERVYVGEDKTCVGIYFMTPDQSYTPEHTERYANQIAKRISNYNQQIRDYIAGLNN